MISTAILKTNLTGLWSRYRQVVQRDAPLAPAASAIGLADERDDIYSMS